MGSLIFCFLGALPFILFGIITAYYNHWVVAAWCTAVVAAFADWGRHIVRRERNASGYIAGALMLLSIVAAIELPQYFQVTEKIKFNGAVEWIGAVNDAENRSFAATGKYSNTPLSLDHHLKPLNNFSLVDVALSTGTPPTWMITLRRKPLFFSYCPIFDCYTVTYKSLENAKRREDSLTGRFTCSNTGCADSLLPN